MTVKNRQHLNDPADDVLAELLFEKLSADILVEILKHKIAAGQASVSDVIRDLAGEKEAAVVIMKRH